MSGHSPIDSLTHLAPVSDAEAVAAFAAAREELLDGVIRQPIGRRARPRPVPRRRRLVLALAVLALAAIATAATWVAIARNGPARETTSVECLIKGVDTIIPSTSGDPARDCAVEWQRELGNAAPPLAAYDNTYGGVTVLPRSRKPPAGWKSLGSQDVALIELQDSLDDYVNGLNSSCLDDPAATAVTKAKLAEFGFRGWAVTVTSGPSQPVGVRTCTGGAYVDASHRTVSLGHIGVPNGPSRMFQKLADELRPLTRGCESLPAAVASVRAVASSLGLSKSARGYELNSVTDNSLRCASIYETVGGTIFLTVRGPAG
jgi:hypothetical protein